MSKSGARFLDLQEQEQAQQDEIFEDSERENEKRRLREPARVHSATEEQRQRHLREIEETKDETPF